MIISNFKEYQSQILALPHQCQELFCCCCAEHVMPFYQYYCPQNEFSLALDKVWQFARGHTFSIQEIEELEESLTPLIPNIQEDTQIEADLLMKAGVTVLETLDCLMGESEPAVRCGSLVFDVLTVATHIVGDAGRPVPDFFEAPARFAPDARLHREWLHVHCIMQDLINDKAKCISPSWQVEQREHGQLLLAEFVSKLKI